MPRRNITGRNTTSNGLHLNTGLGTMADFNLVTSVENKELSQSVRLRFANSSSGENDFLSADNHSPQFTQTAGAVIADGGNYTNKWAAKHSQFIAPYDCMLKSVDGYITPTGLGSCGESVDIHISVWMKDVTVGGTSSTAVKLLFTQKFTFASGLSNNYAFQIDGSTYSGVNNSDDQYKIDAKKAVIVSVRRVLSEGASDCGIFTASFNMVFKAKDSHITSNDFKLNTISVANNRYDNTVSNPDKRYIPFQK